MPASWARGTTPPNAFTHGTDSSGPGYPHDGREGLSGFPREATSRGSEEGGGFSPTGRSAVNHPIVGPDLGEETKMLLAKLVSSDAHYPEAGVGERILKPDLMGREACRVSREGHLVCVWTSSSPVFMGASHASPPGLGSWRAVGGQLLSPQHVGCALSRAESRGGHTA